MVIDKEKFKVFDFRDINNNGNEIKQSFNKYGILHVENIFDIELCNQAIKVLLDIESKLDSNKNEVGLVTECIKDSIFIKYYQGLYNVNPIFKKFFSIKLMEIAKLALSADDLFFNEIETHIRNPGGTEIPKHQDNFYFNLAKAKGLTCYIALNPHNIINGGLNYLLSSHKKRVISHDSSDAAGFSSYISEKTVKNNMLKDIKIYEPDFKIGSVTFHHPENIHFAKPAPTSTNRAFALSVRIFSSSEEIDLDGMERYKKNLVKNRNN